ncbi:MAG: hypothetical protein NUV91_10570 [Candidatus Omnitrophica bacterium]|nr:hypothetical protein [Candidatus Omnitrophota bacterium]
MRFMLHSKCRGLDLLVGKGREVDAAQQRAAADTRKRARLSPLGHTFFK